VLPFLAANADNNEVLRQKIDALAEEHLLSRRLNLLPTTKTNPENHIVTTESFSTTVETNYPSKCV
jgi:hypothetical protein